MTLEEQGESRLAELRRPFTVAEAARYGVHRNRLRSPAYRLILPGVHRVADCEPELTGLLQALRGAFGTDIAADGLTALQLHGLDLGDLLPVHLAVPASLVIRRRGICPHRLSELPSGVAEVGPAYRRLCRETGLLEAVTVGDRVLHLQLGELGVGPHGSGVGAPLSSRVLGSPRPSELVRDGSESPRETLLRLALVLTGLPQPSINPWIIHQGAKIARADLLFGEHRLIVEYEGDQHRTDKRQWNRDVDRLSDLSDLGYVVLRFTAAHLRQPGRVAMRVYEALDRRGYGGPQPELSPAWMQVFGSRR